MQKVAYLKRILNNGKSATFRDDRGTVKDMIEQSVENLGKQNRERIVNALRRQYLPLGGGGVKATVPNRGGSQRDLKCLSGIKEEFMKTKMYAPHLFRV